ncbi:hypothetical protein [uncultured Hyphomicrobium sp.]|uniref:hypothetical protein n=1 Tax=uncultured Hyphomicrobium sp. TaxID=194373 RepID=UPI0025E78DC4|nr:hypothetical protein [uncultured Hyphomicrobium sp.]
MDVAIDGRRQVRTPSPMVDSTFIFILVFGGSLVGIVTALVRRHDTLRTMLDIAAGTAGGYVGTPLWLAFVRHILPRIVGPLDTLAPRYSSLAADLYYLSPILGGFLGVGILALVSRLARPRRRDEPWLAILGDAVKIVGIVYLAVALCLTLALVFYAASYGRWDVVSSPALLIDLVYGSAIVLAGWAVRRSAARSL